MVVTQWAWWFLPVDVWWLYAMLSTVDEVTRGGWYFLKLGNAVDSWCYFRWPVVWLLTTLGNVNGISCRGRCPMTTRLEACLLDIAALTGPREWRCTFLKGLVLAGDVFEANKVEASKHQLLRGRLRSRFFLMRVLWYLAIFFLWISTFLLLFRIYYQYTFQNDKGYEQRPAVSCWGPQPYHWRR